MANNLGEISFVTQASKSKIVVVPAFLSDDVLRGSFLPEYYRVVGEEYGNNHSLRKLDSQGRGSNPFISGLAKRILASYGVRPAISADDQGRVIDSMTQGNHYTDFGDLVVHSPTHTYNRNKNLLKSLIEVTEDKVGSVKFPFKVTGMVPELWEEDSENGYGLKFIPAEDFDYVSDKRLNLPTGTRFDVVDERGIIKPNKNGSRTWYSKPNGISRLCLGGNFSDLGSDSDGLGYSCSHGGVVVVDAEGVAPKNSQ